MLSKVPRADPWDALVGSVKALDVDAGLETLRGPAWRARSVARVAKRRRRR